MRNEGDQGRYIVYPQDENFTKICESLSVLKEMDSSAVLNEYSFFTLVM
jgi:hypothetical protein